MEKRKLIRELQSHQSVLKEKAREKARESISAVISIVLIVFILGFTVAALSPGILVEFLVGSVLVILGMIFFSMGAELSMTPMGEHVGGSMLRTKKLGFIVILGFILGFIITISEPDRKDHSSQCPVTEHTDPYCDWSKAKDSGKNNRECHPA